MSKVSAPSLLTVGGSGVAAFTTRPSPRKGASLLRDRVVVSRRDRISAKLGMIPRSSLAASLLTVGGSGVAAFTTRPSPRKGASLLRDRVVVSRRDRISAKLGGDGELKPQGKKKFITREEEPEQYWQTAGEREGENPMKTPLPYIIIFGMSTPFVILAIAFANGWIKVPVR